MLCKDAAISYIKNEGSKFSQLLIFAGIFAAVGVAQSFVILYYKNYKQ